MGIVQIVNSIFSSNTYILSHTDSCRVWLIDIGDIEPVIARLLPGQQIQGVFLTHTHFDHFYGKNRHKAQRKAKFYINKCRSASCMQGGLKQASA